MHIARAPRLRSSCAALHLAGATKPFSPAHGLQAARNPLGTVFGARLLLGQDLPGAPGRVAAQDWLVPVGSGAGGVAAFEGARLECTLCILHLR